MARTHAQHAAEPGWLRLPGTLHRLINTDGRRHPKENALAFLSLGLGLASLVVATQPAWHVAGAWAGLVAAVVGGYDQLISATRGERWVIVVGIGAGALGFALNLAHGGLVP